MGVAPSFRVGTPPDPDPDPFGLSIDLGMEPEGQIDGGPQLLEEFLTRMQRKTVGPCQKPHLPESHEAGTHARSQAGQSPLLMVGSAGEQN